MTSVEDDAAMGVALGDATSAGEILALRDELSEKELELLEMQQSFAELVAKHDEVKAQLKKASRFKEDSANILQSAVKFKEEAQITAKNATERADKLQADLKSTREAAASAKKMATHFKEKCEAEHERAAAAESAAAALRVELETVRKSATAKIAELNEELESRSKESEEVITKKDHELRLRESAEAEARLSAELAKVKETAEDVESKLRAELSRTRDDLALALAKGKVSRESVGDSSGQLLATVQRMTREQLEAAREEVSRAYEIAKSREKEAQDAREKVESLQQSHAVLKATMDQLRERVDDTKRHAETRTEAAARHKATSRNLRKQLAEVHAALANAQAELRLSRRGETRDTRDSGTSAHSGRKTKGAHRSCRRSDLRAIRRAQTMLRTWIQFSTRQSMDGRGCPEGRKRCISASCGGASCGWGAGDSDIASIGCGVRGRTCEAQSRRYAAGVKRRAG